MDIGTATTTANVAATIADTATIVETGFGIATAGIAAIAGMDTTAPGNMPGIIGVITATAMGIAMGATTIGHMDTATTATGVITRTACIRSTDSGGTEGIHCLKPGPGQSFFAL